MKKHKILNSFLILTVFLTGWAYLIRFYALQTEQNRAYANVSPQKILSVGKDLYGEITTGGGYENITPARLAEYRDELQGTITGMDSKELAKSYTSDSSEGRINTDQAVFEPEKTKLKEGNLSPAFASGTTDLNSMQSQVSSATCELEQSKQKELFASETLTKPIADLGLTELQKNALDKLMSVINKVIEKNRKKATENVKKIGKGFRSSF